MKAVVKRVVVAAFLVVFVALAISNFALRRRLTEAESALRVRPPAEAAFREGDVLPRFVARDRSDRVVTVGGATGHDWILVFVHPKCKVCDGVIADLAINRRTDVTVVSLVSRERAAAKTASLPPNTPLFFIDRVQTSPIAPHAHVVPQILRVAADGKIAEVCASTARCGVAIGCATCTNTSESR